MNTDSSPVVRRLGNVIILLLSLCLLAVASSSFSADYRFRPPDPDVVENRVFEFSVTSEEEIKLASIPDHPRMLWLPTSLDTYSLPPEITTSFIQYTAKFSCVPQGTGTIVPPPVPVVIGGQKILLRLPQLTVRPNDSDDQTEMVLLWNGGLKTPDSMRIGETVDLEILAITPPKRLGVSNSFPVMELEPVRWYRSTIAVQGVDPDQYRFFRFGPLFYQPTTSEFRGRSAYIKRFKTRFTVLQGDRLKGLIALPFSQRVHSETLDIPIAPLPPLPDSNYFQTGLVGDCQFTASLSPAEPTSDKPFTITIDIEATGDSKLLLDFDFSKAGFRSIETSQEPLPGSTFDRYRGRFTQTLIADGTSSEFPEVNLLNFDTPSDSWKIHKVIKPIHFSDLAVSLNHSLPLAALGSAIERPVILNLHPVIFLILGGAPFLPILVGFFVKKRRERDPARSELGRQLKAVKYQLKSTSDSDAPSLLDSEAMPLLRAYFKLPDGASTSELANALDKNGDPELAELLRKHAEASFSSEARSPITRKSLGSLLARISFGFLCLLAIPGMANELSIQQSLDIGISDFNEGRYDSAAKRFESLLEEHPNFSSIHFNLAQARLSAEKLHRARASAHTAVLLDPLNQESKKLLNNINHRLGDPPLPGSAFFALRPDQLLTIAAVGWGLGFLFLALRQLSKRITVWPSVVCFIVAVIVLGCALWRNTNTYRPNQYMVVSGEVLRELEPGKPNFDLPPLRSGAIVQAEVSPESSISHIYIETADTAFWLPTKHLQKIW